MYASLSGYIGLQINYLTSAVNLSLEVLKENKKIVL